MTLPVYTMPSGLTFLQGQSSVQTAMVSAVSSGPEGWSSGMPQTLDVSQEGPFDAYMSPMDTGINPLITTGLPGCPYRITSYTRVAVYESGVWYTASSPPVSGLAGLSVSNYILYWGGRYESGIWYAASGFWNLSGRRSRLCCCIIPRRFGYNVWERRMLWRRRSVYSGTPVSCLTFRYFRSL